MKTEINVTQECMPDTATLPEAVVILDTASAPGAILEDISRAQKLPIFSLLKQMLAEENTTKK